MSKSNLSRSSTTNHNTGPQHVAATVVAPQCAAFDRLRALIEAVDLADAPPPNTDVSGATIAALAVVPVIHSERERIEQLPFVDKRAIFGIEDLAYAAQYVQGNFALATQPVETLPSHLEEGTELRTKLSGVGVILTTWNMRPGQPFPAMSGGKGYKSVADDLLSCAMYFHALPEVVRARTPVTTTEVHRAFELSQTIIAGLARRDHRGEGIPEATALRRRAFYLLDKAYSEVRRALMFLRWYEGDVDQLAPSLRANSGTPARKSSPPGATSAAPSTESANSAAPAHDVGSPSTSTADKPAHS